VGQNCLSRSSNKLKVGFGMFNNLYKIIFFYKLIKYTCNIGDFEAFVKNVSFFMYLLCF
jgi:hypothetical protein